MPSASWRPTLDVLCLSCTWCRRVKMSAQQKTARRPPRACKRHQRRSHALTPTELSVLADLRVIGDETPEEAVAMMQSLARGFARHIRPSLPLVGRVDRHTKRQDMKGLPDDWQRRGLSVRGHDRRRAIWTQEHQHKHQVKRTKAKRGYPTDVSDSEWRLIAPLLPVAGYYPALLHHTTVASTSPLLDHKSFTVLCALALIGNAFYAILVHRLMIYAPRFLPTLGCPHAVALHFAHCGQLAAGLAPTRVRPCWAHTKKGLRNAVTP
jgi:hypothetical protein